MRRATFVFILVLAALSGHADQSVSPRIAALESELKAGVAGACERFWSDVEQRGTPLVEPVERDGMNVLVTYLWRGRPGDHGVVVLGDGTPGDPKENQLTLLAGTDVWHRTYRYRGDARFLYALSPNDALTPLTSVAPSELGKRLATVQPDPLNPHRWAGPMPMSVASLPGAPAQPWLDRRPGVANGRVSETRIQSAILANERSVWIYTPPGYGEPDVDYGLLLLLDGESYLRPEAPGPAILDNLIAGKRIQPVVAVGIGNVPGKRTTELTCNEAFARFLAEELVPRIRASFRVSRDPHRTVIGGSSFGALTAAFGALRYPGVFGNVLSQSGSYWWKPAGDSEFEWLTRLYSEGPRQRVRFYVEVGLMESSQFPDGRPTQVAANRRFQNVLRSRGYQIAYSEFNGDHSMLNWRGSLAVGLMELLGRAEKPPTPFPSAGYWPRSPA